MYQMGRVELNESEESGTSDAGPEPCSCLDCIAIAHLVLRFLIKDRPTVTYVMCVVQVSIPWAVCVLYTLCAQCNCVLCSLCYV